MNYAARLQRLQKRLSALSIDLLLVEHRTDLLYLTGLDLSAGMLFLTEDEASLFVDGRYLEACRERSPCPVFLTGDMVIEEYLRKHSSLSSLGFDSSTTSYKRFLALLKSTEAMKQISLAPIEAPLQPLRAVKDKEEIVLLREAAELGCRGFDFVLSQLREGITEGEVAKALEIFWLQQGGQKLAFEPIIAFGANSSKPHYRAGNAVLHRGQPVLIDIGVTWRYYHSDMTRVVYFGAPSKKLVEIYHVVQEAQETALRRCKAGVTAGELDTTARDIIAAAGYGESFTHSLGHGIGLDIHEFPTLRSHPSTRNIPMVAGMVITIEPGIYLPGVGGVRIEDTIIITADGYENLTPRSKEFIII